MYSPLVTFAPDAETTSQGIITDCENIIPTVRGVKAAPTGVSAGYAALAAACTGAVIAKKTDGTRRLLAATSTNIYEGSGGTWSSVGSGFTNSDGGWRFAQFGNVTIATNKVDTMQASTIGAFSALTIKAALIDTVNNFVFAADTNDATYGDQSDRWWCAALGGYTDWTPSIATQSATDRITETPGGFTACRRLRDNIVLYKKNAIHLGQYGLPTIWSFITISDSVGTVAQESVVSIDIAHIFIAEDDIYSFDGSTVTSIGGGIREWFLADLSATYAYKTRGMWDAKSGLVYFFYVSTASSTLDKYIVFNHKNGKWGRGALAVEVPLAYITQAVTYDTLGDLYATYADLPQVSYDSPFWLQGSPLPAYFDTSHVLKTLTGAADTSYITTGDVGIDDRISLIRRVRPRFKTTPTSASMVNYYRDDLGSAVTTDATTTMSTGKFDVLRSARWHKAKISFVGDMEIYGLDLDAIDDGAE